MKNLSKQLTKMFEGSQVNQKVFFAGKREIVLFYIENLVNTKQLAVSVLSQISKICEKGDFSSLKDKVKQSLLVASKIEEITNPDEVAEKVFAGSVCVVIDEQALSFSLFEPNGRGVEEPPTSRVIKGPREGFVEDVLVNLSLVRKRIKTKNLKIKDYFIGNQTRSHIVLMFVEGIAKQCVVKEVEKRIESINVDAILDSYYIESFLEDKKLKFFRRVGNTEKPDVFASKILEGRVGIIVDGSPIALTVPFMFLEDLQSPDDYYSVPAKATFSRFMRLIGLVFAVLAPGVYVALQSFNYRLLPMNFLIILLESIEGLSVPPLVEILVVLLLFEVITEASLQMPSALSMALSIIGALALGNTAVDAGIISPPSIVVVAVSSVAVYIIPDQISQTRLIRMLFTVVGGIAGLYGIVMVFMIMVSYMCSIKSFGVPYLAMYAPSIKADKKDGLIKEELTAMLSRPKMIAGKNKIRQRTKTKELNLTEKRTKK